MLAGSAVMASHLGIEIFCKLVPYSKAFGRAARKYPSVIIDPVLHNDTWP